MGKTRAFLVLDGLRGIAALCVVTVHAAPMLGWEGSSTNGYLAVDLFFLMSGFVVAFAYRDKLVAGTLRPLDLIRLRLVRLYPLYFLGGLWGFIILVLKLVKHADDTTTLPDLFTAFVAHLFLLPTHLDADGFLYAMNFPAWTLTLEIMINIVFAFTWRYWNDRNVLCWVVAMVLGLGLIAYHGGAGLGGGSFWRDWYVGIARVLFGFPAGVLLFSLWSKGALSVRTPWLVPVVLTGIVLGMAPTRYFHLVGFVSICFAFPLILLLAVNSSVPRVLRSSFSVLGTLSYPMYAVHAPLIAFLYSLGRLAGLELQHYFPWSGICTLIAIVLVAAAVFLAFDAPIRGRMALLLFSARNKPAVVARV